MYPPPPPPFDCVSAYLSCFLCLSREQRWCVVVISKVCDTRTGQLFFLFMHVCVFVYVSVCVLCMWQIWDILDCCWESDTPLQAIVFKRNFQQTPNHNLADHCHEKSLSCCNAYSQHWITNCGKLYNSITASLASQCLILGSVTFHIYS